MCIGLFFTLKYKNILTNIHEEFTCQIFLQNAESESWLETSWITSKKTLVFQTVFSFQQIIFKKLVGCQRKVWGWGLQQKLIWFYHLNLRLLVWHTKNIVFIILLFCHLGAFSPKFTTNKKRMDDRQGKIPRPFQSWPGTAWSLDKKRVLET